MAAGSGCGGITASACCHPFRAGRGQNGIGSQSYVVVHGEKAHSRYMGEDAFKKLQGDNKRLLIVPGANHTDLYDKMEIIPFDEIAAFYREYLK
jgi:fermentation-respiration switch protein FrsA (DUF1100 family)